MKYLLTIHGRLPGFNEYIAANRSNPYKGADMKRHSSKLVRKCIDGTMGDVIVRKPAKLIFKWYEKDRRRDRDNVSSYGRKVIQDALVESGVLKNDGWNEVVGFSDEFYVDKENPRIEVIIQEVG